VSSESICNQGRQSAELLMLASEIQISHETKINSVILLLKSEEEKYCYVWKDLVV